MSTHQDSPHLRQKPPTQEDEYFAQEDAQRIRALQDHRREQEETLRREQTKATHWMHCPKCGSKLIEVVYEGILVDRCEDCNGIWFDSGELKALLDRQEGPLLKFVRRLGGR